MAKLPSESEGSGEDKTDTQPKQPAGLRFSTGPRGAPSPVRDDLVLRLQRLQQERDRGAASSPLSSAPSPVRDHLGLGMQPVRQTSSSAVWLCIILGAAIVILLLVALGKL